MASKNAQDGISMIQTAEGAMNETHSILQRMRELAVQASNDTSTDADRSQIQKEVGQLKSEIDRISASTEFNSKKLLNGSLGGASASQGTVENSNQFKSAIIAATSGSVIAGANLLTRDAVTAVAGTAASTTGSTAVGTTTVITATNQNFKVTVNGFAQSADLPIATGTYDRAGFLTAVNNALTGYNTGKNLSEQVAASYTADFKLVFTSKVTGAGTSVAVASGSTNDAFATMGMTGATTTNGTDTVKAVTAGVTKIVSSVNDQFQLTVDGGTAQTLTLSAKDYAKPQDLLAEVNAQIQNNNALNGKVAASLDANNKIIFTSASTGSTSSVAVTDPTAASQSALAALGYKGKASTIDSVLIDNSAGTVFDLNTVGTDAKFDLTIGNKTVTIDLTGQAGIDKNATRDSILTALQSKIDGSFFGAGAVTVKTDGTKITLVNNTASDTFKIVNGANTGAAKIFGNATTTAVVGAYNNGATVTGSDATGGTLSNATMLTGLTDKDGNNLNLTAGNVITIAGTQNGSAFSTNLTVASGSTVNDLINQLKTVPALAKASISLDSTTGQINIIGENGAAKDISNLKFSATKSATDTTAVANFNKLFTSFKVTQDAKDAKTDSSVAMQIGANQGQNVNIDINEMSTQALRINSVDVSTQQGAQTAISVISNAADSVSTERAKLGAFQNRLEHTIANLLTSSENLTAAESRIRDVDMAKEMMNQTKNSILAQAAQAMLAQANQQPQGVLQLLR
jgi:flagellin